MLKNKFINSVLNNIYKNVFTVHEREAVFIYPSSYTINSKLILHLQNLFNVMLKNKSINSVLNNIYKNVYAVHEREVAFIHPLQHTQLIIDLILHL